MDPEPIDVARVARALGDRAGGQVGVEEEGLMKRRGWKRLSDPKASKCYQRWLHEPSGWQVVHCGHPTANWPWYATDPAAPGLTVVSENGHAFRLLPEAMDAVERVVAGWFVTVATPLSPDHVRRVVRP